MVVEKPVGPGSRWEGFLEEEKGREQSLTLLGSPVAAWPARASVGPRASD